MEKFIISRTKILTDGTVKTIEQKIANTKAEAHSKGYANYANDLVDKTLNGSITIVYGLKGEILCNLAWDREQFPLEEVTAE